MSDHRTPTGTILVLYADAPAALVSSRQVSFVGDIRHLPPGDPVVRIVAHKAYYAQLVLAGQMPARYTDHDARQFARFALIDPDEFVAHATDADDALAAHFRVPVHTIEQARRELGSGDAR